MFKRIMRLVRKFTRKRQPYKRVIQVHHIRYADPAHGIAEWKVSLYKGEHFICTQLQRRTHVSKGFVVALEDWLASHRQRAIDLDDKQAVETPQERLKIPKRKQKT